MGLIAAAGDTWGISGPDFLRFYLVVVLIGVAYYVLSWRSAHRGRPIKRRLDQYEAALLSGGPGRAIGASLMAMRLAGVIESAGPGLVRTSASPPAAGLEAPTLLDRAIEAAVAKGDTRVSGLAWDSNVVKALDSMRTRLQQHGLMVGDAAARPLRRALLLLVAIVALGIARLIAGLANGRPVGYLLLILVVLVAAVIGAFVLLQQTVRRGTTAASRAALAELRESNGALKPSMSPSWQTYGAPAAAMAVALFGWAAIDSIDPEFAAATELSRALSALPGAGLAGSGSSGSSSSSPYVGSCGSSSSSCSGGSSCSSGSSCGGGGCGG